MINPARAVPRLNAIVNAATALGEAGVASSAFMVPVVCSGGARSTRRPTWKSSASTKAEASALGVEPAAGPVP